MKYKVIITGSTGMVGRGVLLECLDSDIIEKVLVINRSTIDIQHPKLKEVILKDFSQFEPIKAELIGYDACFHCMGVSAAGMSEEKYNALTFEVTKNLADILYELNPNFIFHYVSGLGTNSSETGGAMWARVKGKTENYLLNKGFKRAIMFRPGFIVPERGIRSKTKVYQVFYTILNPFMGILKKSKNITTTTKIGLVMIDSLTNDFQMTHLQNSEINHLSTQ